MTNKRTALVILNWNGKHLLERFLPGIIECTPSEIEIIVADNASQDDSVEFLKKQFPGIRIIEMKENLGFAGGYNKALESVDADYFILLNSDMEVSEAWTEPCLRLLDDYPDVAALQPKIRSFKNRAYFEYAGAAGGFLDHLGYPFCRGRIFEHLEKDTGQYDDVCEVFWATGAAMFVRADAFRDAGGFDASFFAHMEEVELCWRLQTKGYRIMYCPQSVVYHLGGGSLPKANPQKTFYNFRNSLWMLAKQLPPRSFYARILPRLILDAIAAEKFFLQGHFRDFLAVFRAHLAFYSNYRKLRKHYRENKSDIPEMLYRRSIVADHFLLGKKTYTDLAIRPSMANA
jgi:GT2 family glycosyltransferase